MIHCIIRGINHKPEATRALEEIIGKADSLSGELVYGYPLTGTENGLFTVDAVLVSDEGQVAVIDLAQGRDAGEYRERQDRGFNLIVRLLRMDGELMEGRRLRVHIQTLTFGPELDSGDETDPEHPVVTGETLLEALERCQAEQETGVDPNTVLSDVLMTARRAER